jgi:hypothetical protein
LKNNYFGGALSNFHSISPLAYGSPTFVSAKVGKTMVICKTCSFYLTYTMQVADDVFRVSFFVEI